MFYREPTNAAAAPAAVTGTSNTGTSGVTVPGSPTTSVQSTNQPRITWRKSFGNGFCEGLDSVQQTSDGGYILAGDTTSDSRCSNDDAWLIKTDADGNVLWDKKFGGPEESETQITSDSASNAQQTSDGGYIAIGNTRTINANKVAWLIKTDSNGNKLWDKVVEGPVSEDLSYRSSGGQQTSDGGYIIVGETSKDHLWLAKTDANGNKLWDKTFPWVPDANVDAVKPSVQQTNDGGYIICGTNSSAAWLVRTDSQGNELWSRPLGSKYGNFAQQTNDGGYIIAGTKENWIDHSIYSNASLVKTDSAGKIEWSKKFDAKSAIGVRQTSDGGYVLVGLSSDDYTTTPVWVIKTDSAGNKEWDKTFGASDKDEPRSIQQTSDGGYIIVGQAGYPWLAKIDVNKDTVSTTEKSMPKTYPQQQNAKAEEKSKSTSNPQNLQTKTATSDAKSPGFEVTFSIAALLGIFILWRRD
jgi:hypothetical protein